MYHKKPSPTGRKLNESKERPNSQKSKENPSSSDTKSKKDAKNIKRSETGSVIGGASSSASGNNVNTLNDFIFNTRRPKHTSHVYHI